MPRRPRRAILDHFLIRLVTHLTRSGLPRPGRPSGSLRREDRRGMRSLASDAPARGSSLTPRRANRLMTSRGCSSTGSCCRSDRVRVAFGIRRQACAGGCVGSTINRIGVVAVVRSARRAARLAPSRRSASDPRLRATGDAPRSVCRGRRVGSEGHRTQLGNILIRILRRKHAMQFLVVGRDDDVLRNALHAVAGCQIRDTDWRQS